MADPIVYFNYQTLGLDVNFKNLTSNVNGATTYDWAFGDGTIDNIKDPAKTYTSAGFFTVTLTVTKDAVVYTFETQIGVNDIGKPTPSNLSLLDLINQVLPPLVVLDTSRAVNDIRKWQEFIFPLVDPPSDESEKYLELSYDPLANRLIAQLVTIDLIVDAANSFLINQGTLPGSKGKEIKKITTGPADSEWFAGSDTWATMMKKGGAFETLQKQACIISARLNIWLPFCPALAAPVIVPCVVHNTKTTNINKFDF